MTDWCVGVLGPDGLIYCEDLRDSHGDRRVVSGIRCDQKYEDTLYHLEISRTISKILEIFRSLERLESCMENGTLNTI